MYTHTDATANQSVGPVWAAGKIIVTGGVMVAAVVAGKVM